MMPSGDWVCSGWIYCIYISTSLIETLSIYIRDKWMEARESPGVYNFVVCDWGCCGTESHSAVQPGHKPNKVSSLKVSDSSVRTQPRCLALGGNVFKNTFPILTPSSTTQHFYKTNSGLLLILTTFSCYVFAIRTHGWRQWHVSLRGLLMCGLYTVKVLQLL